MNPQFITLINPSGSISKHAHYVIHHGIPPLGLAYVSGALKKLHIPHTVIDAVGLGLDQYELKYENNIWVRGLSTSEIISAIPSQTTLIGISCMFSCDWMHISSIIADIKKTYPHMKICLGGEHASADYEIILKNEPNVDFIIKGEGEKAFAELYECLRINGSIENVPSIAFIKNNEIFLSKKSDRLMKVDFWPNWELFPIENYLTRKLGATSLGRRTMPMLATRGCPYQCTFCTSPQMWGTNYVMRDHQDIINEMKYLYEKYKIEHICFTDLTLTTNMKWTLEFCEAITKAKIPITFEMSSGTRSEILTYDVIKKLKDAGVTILSYSPESGDIEEIARMNKRVKRDKIKRSMQNAADMGIRVKASFIIGLPGQKFKTALKTILFGHYLTLIGVDDVAFYPFAPYPGTEEFQNIVESKGDMFHIRQDYKMYCRHLAYNTHVKVGNNLKHNVSLIEKFIPFLTYLPMVTCFFLSLIVRPIRIIEFLERLFIGKVVGLFDIALYTFLSWQINRIFGFKTIGHFNEESRSY